jgi:hypothetical protein
MVYLNGGFMEVPEGEDPIEFIQKVMAQAHEEHESQVIEAQAKQDEIWDFIGGLSLDDLRTVLLVLKSIEQGGARSLNILSGAVSARLKFEHGMCVGCGQDHINDYLKSQGDSHDSKD